MQSHPLALVILDGYGYSPEIPYNAIFQAKKSTLDYLMNHYPHTLLDASGKAVGLPDGYMGNSEVGHTTLGAGRIIPSAFLQLHTQIENGQFFSNPILISNLDRLATSGQTLHIMGLLSDAGVQCHQEIIYAVIQAAITHNVKRIIIHAFLDGRDTPPESGAFYLEALQNYIKNRSSIALGSITGRYYAMDRDKNWDRTCAAYQMLTTKIEPQFKNWQTALSDYYSNNISDEFVPPTLLDKNGIITEGDGIIFANFREDRARQLTECFITPRKTFCSNKPPQLNFFISAIKYDQRFEDPVLLTTTPAKDTLKEILSRAGKTIFSIAETEKFAHVTYFFADGREAPFPNETRILIPSLRLKNYIDHPEMSAQKITDAVRASLTQKPCDFYLINYANADMVGHSGDLPATIKAIECLDAQIKELYELVVKKMHGTVIITADHGNAELKYDKKIGQPHTSHTTNKVPFIFVKNEPGYTKSRLPLHGLANVAPFILRQMKVE